MRLLTRLNGKDITLNVTKRKNQKRIIIRGERPGVYKVTASKRHSTKVILEVVHKNSATLTALLTPLPIEDAFVENSLITLFSKPVYIRLRTGEKAVQLTQSELIITHPTKQPHLIKAMVKSYLKARLLNEVEQFVKSFNPYFKTMDLDLVTFKTQYMKSKFGSCQPKLKRISLNLELIHYDKKMLEYIIIHELCHLVHANHSRDFYHLVKTLCPDYKAIKQDLNAYRKALFYQGFDAITAL